MRSMILASAAAVAVLSMSGAAQATPAQYCALGYTEYCQSETDDATSASQTETQRATVQTVATTVSKRIARFASGGLTGGAGATNTAGLSMTGVSTGDMADAQKGVWGAASHGRIDDDSTVTPFAAEANTFMLGGDMLFDGGILAGVTLSYEDVQSRLDLPDGENETTGWMITPYVAKSYMGGAVVVDALVGYGQSDTDVARNIHTAAPVAGKYESDRYVAAVNGTYQTLVGDAALLAGKAGYIYAYEDGSDYTDSAGVVFGDQDSRLGTLRLEGQGSYMLGDFEPFAAVAFLYDAQRSKVVGAKNDRTAFEARLGATYYVSDTVSAGAEYMEELSRSAMDNRSLTLNIRATF